MQTQRLMTKIEKEVKKRERLTFVKASIKKHAMDILSGDLFGYVSLI